MTGRYKAYPEYRKSQIEWMHDVPVHWNNVPLKYMAIEDNSLFLDGDWIESKDISNEGIRYITTGNVGEGIYKEQGAGFITETTFNKLSCTEVFEGDLLLSRLNAPIGRSCIVPNLSARVVTSVDNVIFRPDAQYLKQFLVYLFSSSSYFKHTSNLARGATMQRISRGLLGNIRVVIPTYEEQQKITNFLDHETAKIDTLITKQEKLIALLKEKRQAVISHAVTKGLNPDAPMKDSGVEWLGEVPEHWVVSSIKYVSSFVGTGGTPKNVESFTDKVEMKWFTPGDFSTDVELSRASKHITPASILKGEAKVYKENSVLVIGIGATLGKVALCKSSFSCNQQINIITPNKKIITEFLYYSLLAQTEQMKQSSNASTLAIMNQEKTKMIQLMQPSIKNQAQIVEYLNKKLNTFEAIECKGIDQIELLKERKIALISAAVTGKIDVRDWEKS